MRPQKSKRYRNHTQSSNKNIKDYMWSDGYGKNKKSFSKSKNKYKEGMKKWDM